MITESRRHRGYVIDLVSNAPRWEALIYPLSKLAPQLSSNLPPIHYKKPKRKHLRLLANALTNFS